MKFTAVKKHLKEDSIAPCYVLTGEDAYIIAKTAEMFRDLVLSFKDFNLYRFKDSYKCADILAAAARLPLMGDRIVIEVSNFNLDPKDILSYIKNPFDYVTLVFVAPSINKNIAQIAKESVQVQCDRLDEISLKNWIVKRATDNGSSISEFAAQLLVEYCEGYMARIESETDKLSLYKHGGKIEAGDIELLVMPSAEYKIYELGDAILKRQGEVAMRALNSIMDATSSGYIITGLYMYFRRLLYATICKEPKIAEYLGVKDFAITAARRQAAILTPKEIKTICDRFQRADFDFKSGRISDEMAAVTIVARIVAEIGGN